ncbi:hypothetical protein U6A24_01900 [Aquimarina gracilis]|uniref:Uncharacterized protein n=1 Tax=Aquimarina gracilis TaxID=874422 RepID=A0ABU5ZSE0_9FLAO|nr:hypothetical protein [Aquimarina gracilis]MEB3344191.1 hypothetical protein [Aquimarina gracilis]
MDQETLIILRNFSTIIELVSAILGTIFYSKYKNSVLKFFLFYLWFIVLLEISGYIIVEYRLVENNAWLFNLFYLISFTFLFYLYSAIVKNKKKKRIIQFSSILYLLIFVINGFFENYLTSSQTIPFIVASALLIVAIIFYFVGILSTEKVLHAKKNLLFWISIGFLLFYAGSIPFRIALNYYANIGGFNELFSINYLLIIVLNICFIIGFIWSDKKQSY